MDSDIVVRCKSTHLMLIIMVLNDHPSSCTAPLALTHGVERDLPSTSAPHDCRVVCLLVTWWGCSLDGDSKGNTYDDTAMIVGVIIAFLVVVVLVVSIVWLVWFAPAKVSTPVSAVTGLV